MSMEQKIPGVRFEGFIGEWEEKRLDDLCTLITKQTGFDYSASIKPSLVRKKSNKVYPFIQNKDFNGPNINLETDFYIPFEVANKYPKILIDVPSVLISISGKIGNVGFYQLPEKALVGGAVGICKLKCPSDGLVIIHQLLSRVGQEYFQTLTKSSSHANITVEDIRLIKTKLPSTIEEKSKIGAYFNHLDNLINQHQQKHDKLNNIKKAMLEKMFPKQGETMPEIRFKGFSGEWEHSTIGDCSSLITKGTTPMTIGRSFVNSGVTFVKVESLDEMGNLNPSKFAHIDMETDQILARSRIKENDLLVSIAGALGRAAIVKKDILPANTNQALAIVRLKNDSPVKIEFLYHFTKTKDFKNFVDASASQGAQPNLSLGDISNVRILAPKKEEQAAIGNYFQKLDALINQHQQQITKLNNIKQACLSKMFV